MMSFILCIIRPFDHKEIVSIEMFFIVNQECVRINELRFCDKHRRIKKYFEYFFNHL